MFVNEPRRQRMAWCLLLGYVFVASGAPLPLGAVAIGGAAGDAIHERLSTKDRSQPFPCMDKPCGCATAEQCFTNCCCNTPAETLTWARARAVSRQVLVALERRAAAAGRPVPPVACCASASAATCCAGSASGAADPDTGAGGRRSCCPDEGLVDEAPRGTVRMVTMQAMLACGGLLAHWSAAAAAPPPPRVAVPRRPALARERLAVEDESRHAIRPAPEPPPPRTA